MKKNDEGFTLIELLIVIVILGILATIVVFAVRGVTEDSQANSCKASQKTYQVAIEAWYAQGNATTANPAPSGGDLAAAELIRSYDSTAVEVIDGSAGVVSTVGPTAGGKCVGLITAS